MRPPRRQFLRLAATGIAALPAVSRIARAEPYPLRPVRLIVPGAPGGTADLIARLIGQWLSDRLGQPFVIENRAGAAGNIAAEAVVRAPANGYMLLLVNVSNAINTTLYEKLNFNFVHDVVPVGSINRTPGVMEVNPSFPAETVREFISYAKANPGKISMATSGVGSAAHVYGELFKMMAGVDLVHVPYRGGDPALTDLLGGQVQVMFGSVPESLEHIRSRNLRALAVTTASRVEVLPDIPTLGNFLPGYEASAWQGIGAPRGTPVEIIDRLNWEINAGLANASLKARLADLGTTVLPGSPAEFGRLIAEETEKWARVVKFAGIKSE